jgi:2-polyprenyl-3-methyl-5-hydroxy-6-metoxy-1,4-benzoquinol methylase
LEYLVRSAMDCDVAFIRRYNCAVCEADKKRILLSIEFTKPSVWEFIDSYYQGRPPKNLFSNGRYELAKCEQCGFIWQTHILNDQGLRRLYGEWISAADSQKKKKHADLSLYSGYAREVEIIPRLVGRKFPGDVNVLDYGMGWGHWCLMAKAFGLNIMGLDLSDERTRLGHKNGIKVVSDPTQLAPASIDFINAEQVFEHIPSPRQTLEDLVQALVPGGVTRIAVPDGRRIESKVKNPTWKAAKDAAHPLEHVNIFTNQSLKTLGQLAGLQVMDQPFLLSGRRGVKSLVRGIAGKYYKQYLSTALYFRKTV